VKGLHGDNTGTRTDKGGNSRDGTTNTQILSFACLPRRKREKKKKTVFLFSFFLFLSLSFSFILSFSERDGPQHEPKTPPTTPIVDFVGDKKIVEVPIESTSLIFLAVIAMWFPRLCKDVGTLIDSFSSVRPVPWGSPMLWYA
jgi:hypothetical protein